MKAMSKADPWERIQQNNTYMGKTCDELLSYLSGDNYCAPEMRTPEWNKFIFALVHAESVGGLTE